MHYVEAGDAAGEPAMLVHGWPQSFYEWRDVIGPLVEAGYRVIAPDLRGLGWSDTPRGGYGKEAMANDLAALLDTLGIESTHLAGHDWGGFISFLLAINHPGRVRSCLACNTVHPWLRLRTGSVSRLPRVSYQWAVATPGLNRRLLARKGVMERFITTGTRFPDAWSEDDIEVYAERLRDPARVRATQGIYGNFNTRELIPMLRGRFHDRRLRAPTLLLFGVRDFVISPADLDGYEPHADDMRIELVPDAAHFIVEEMPELVAERALSLFAAATATATQKESK